MSLLCELNPQDVFPNDSCAPLVSVQARFQASGVECVAGHFHSFSEILSLPGYTIPVGQLRTMLLRVHLYFGMALFIALYPFVPVSYFSWTGAGSFNFQSACPAKVVCCKFLYRGTSPPLFDVNFL